MLHILYFFLFSLLSVLCIYFFLFFFFFFFNDTATTEIYTLSLHDALPISGSGPRAIPGRRRVAPGRSAGAPTDRKSTRLNSSHSQISYAVFCLKKKKKKKKKTIITKKKATNKTTNTYNLKQIIINIYLETI